MVGSEVLNHCLSTNQITTVITLGRSPTGKTHHKLREIEHEIFSIFQHCRMSWGKSTLFITVSAYIKTRYLKTIFGRSLSTINML